MRFTVLQNHKDLLALGHLYREIMKKNEQETLQIIYNYQALNSNTSLFLNALTNKGASTSLIHVGIILVNQKGIYIHCNYIHWTYCIFIYKNIKVDETRGKRG